MMKFEDYEKLVFKTGVYPHLDNNILYPAVGASGEAGELLEKVKKLWRDTDWEPGKSLDGYLSREEKIRLLKEVGDNLWYLARVAHELGYTLSDAAKMNMEKLNKRIENNTLHGAGDDR